MIETNLPLQQHIETLVKQENLPPAFTQTVQHYYLPLAQRIAAHHQQLNRPLLVGVNGAQGTGKSTLALFLQALLQQQFNLPCARFSLDDIYLTKAERLDLAQRVHPLFKTRGVPGTHDLTLGADTVAALQQAAPGQVTPIPAFDKAQDDRVAPAQWPVFEGPAAVVIVEGWCVGAQPLPEATLEPPINELERLEDANGQWRGYMNQQLRGAYHTFFESLDYLVMLKAPSMDCVLEWRTLQEQKLAARLGVPYNGASEPGKTEAVPSGLMNRAQIERFVQHYERLTRHMLAHLPSQANDVFYMNADHQITEVSTHG